MADQELGSLVLYLKAYDDGYTAALADSKAKAQELDAQQKQTEQSAKDLADAFKNIGIAITAAIAFVDQLLKAYGGLEDATIKLNNAFNAQGWEASTASGQIEQLAESLEGSTRFSREATDSAAAMLEQLTGMSEAMVAKAIPAIQDLASAMGMDLTTAAESVGRAMDTGALRIGRMTISFKDIQDPGERFAAIMETLNQKFGGMAQALGESTIGSMTKLNNALRDLAEAGGRALSFALVPIFNLITPILKGFADWAEAGEKFVDAEKAVNAGTATAAQQLLYYNQELVNSKAKIKDLQAELEPTSATMLNTWGPAKAALIAEITRQIQVQTDIVNFAATTIKDINQLTDQKQAKTKAAQDAATAAAAQEKAAAVQEKADDQAWQERMAQRKTTEAQLATLNKQAADQEKKAAADELAYLLKNLNELSGAEATTQKAISDAKAKSDADQEKSDEEKTKKEIDNLTNVLKSYKDVFASLGQAIDAGTLSWKSFAEVAIHVFGKILDSIGDQLAGMAAADLVKAAAAAASLFGAGAAPGYFAAAAIELAGAGAAWTAGAALEGLTLEQGGSFTVPPGFQNDSFPVAVSSGEQVSVTPAGKQGDQLIHNAVFLDGRQISEYLFQASRDRRLLIHAGAIVQ